MKQVSPKKYDQKFYQTIYGEIDLDSLDFTSATFYYKELVRLAPPKRNETVIDYGCGNGNLSLYLRHAFGCKVIGIDYSADAIKIANKRLKFLLKKYPKRFQDIQFKNLNNDEIPKYKNISIVYLCDVIEHMYDHEIELLFSQIPSWSTQRPIRVAIHTDNNAYLTYIRPFINLLHVIAGHITLDELQKAIAAEEAVHVNLTNPRKLKKTLEKLGFKEIIHHFAKPTRERVDKQLGPLHRIPLFTSLIVFILPYLSFFNPSFFALYEYQRQ